METKEIFSLHSGYASFPFIYLSILVHITLLSCQIFFSNDIQKMSKYVNLFSKRTFPFMNTPFIEIV